MEKGFPNVRLLLLGKQIDKIWELLEHHAGKPKVLASNRLATAVKFYAMFNAADTKAVCYPRHVGSSSILLRTAFSNAPAVVSDRGLIGWATKTSGLRMTCDSTFKASIKLALRRRIQVFDSMKASPGNRVKSENPGAEALFRFHSEANHFTHWTARYHQENGIPAATMPSFESTLPNDMDALAVIDSTDSRGSFR